jgi:hypothetical protein
MHSPLHLLRLVLFVLTFGGYALAQTGAPQSVALERSQSTEPVITIFRSTGSRTVSLADLERLPMYRVRTSTFWPNDDGVYEGPLLRDVLADFGLTGVTAIRVIAVDGFSQIIPSEDWTLWPLVLATRRDGRRLTTLTKGPVRLIYPRDMAKALLDPKYRLRWVWLVTAIRPISP